MVSFVPPPDPRSLLPPLLACLPTAFASARPPPALLSLLSPILRQRLHLLGTQTQSSTSSSDSWLKLLSWNSEAAAQVVDTVSESDAFELHPVSGEIDYGQVGPLKYRRLDVETLQARIDVPDLEVSIVYVWCQGDDSETLNGWKVSEILPSSSSTQSESQALAWYSTIAEANSRSQANEPQPTTQQGGGSLQVPGRNAVSNSTDTSREMDDDDYWAQYDATPGVRSSKASPAPGADGSSKAGATSEADYFARYASVQPEMDNDDPSQDRRTVGESTLNGDTLAEAPKQQVNGVQNGRRLVDVPGIQPDDRTSETNDGSAPVSSTAELAIQQHVGASIKSLFRLCKNTGMRREEFEQMVQLELQTLALIEEED